MPGVSAAAAAVARTFPSPNERVPPPPPAKPLAPWAVSAADGPKPGAAAVAATRRILAKRDANGPSPPVALPTVQGGATAGRHPPPNNDTTTTTPRPSALGRTSGPTPFSTHADSGLNTVGRCIRNVAIALVSLLFLMFAVLITLPLFIELRNETRAALMFPNNVPCTTQLQATNQVPWASLDEQGVACLHGAVLLDMVEDIDRDVRRRERAPGWANSTEANHQVATAYLYALHRARLYSRSRAAAWLRALLVVPLVDAWRFGLSPPDGVSVFAAEDPLRLMLTRLWDAGTCMRHDDELPCPSLHYYFDAARGSQAALHVSDGDFWFAAKRLVQAQAWELIEARSHALSQGRCTAEA